MPRDIIDEFLNGLLNFIEPAVENAASEIVDRFAEQFEKPKVKKQPGICQCQYFGKVGPGPCRFCGKMFEPQESKKYPKQVKQKPSGATKRQDARQNAPKPAKVATLYDRLQISPAAEPQTIRAAYLSLIRRFHPDTCKLPDAEEKTKSITEAYEILFDEEKRREYDRWLGIQ